MALQLDAATTTVITMECQRGVIGDLATFASLRSSIVEGDTIARMAEVLDAARRHGAGVAHALAVFREDRAGSFTNAPLLRYTATIPGQLLEGTPAAELVAELGPEPGDMISTRRHGVSPFTGTDLDALLRSRSTTTVIAIGVSLNVGILGLCIEAVNLGYEVIVAVDATAAIPPSYAEVVIANTLGQLATISTSAEVIDALAKR